MFFLAGSPIEARANSSNYTLFFYVIVIAIFLIAVNFLVKLVKAKVYSESKNPKKTTTVAMVLRIAKIYNLTIEQRDFLIYLCKKNKIPNLEANLHSENFFNNFFFKYYNEIRENKENISEWEIENQIAILFSLRQKIENSKKNLSNLASSIAIPEGHTLFLYNDAKEQFECKILHNTKESLVLSLPKNNLELTYKPEALSKITLYYQTNYGSAYILDSRVIRYQLNIEGEELVVSHSNHLKCYQRRKYKRVAINNTCNFSAVKTSTISKGSETIIDYEPLERKHQGKLIEVSAGGCSILTNLHIKNKQYIHIELSIDGKTTDNVVGLIINTTENINTDSYVLHIVFVNISKKTRNKIFSKVYEYLS
jgi:c-di-GMP-binding flagellar brake protein YcgR